MKVLYFTNTKATSFTHRRRELIKDETYSYYIKLKAKYEKEEPRRASLINSDNLTCSDS